MYIRSKGNFYKMGHKDAEISNLIYCFLRGTLVEEKQKELNRWLEEPGNRELFDRICDKEQILKKSFRFDRYDKEKSWKQLEKKMQVGRKSYWRRWGVAASLMLPLLFVGWLYMHENDKSSFAVIKKEIVPGMVCARLELANGEVLHLGKDTITSLALTNGGVIKNDRGAFSYFSDTVLGNDSKYNVMTTPRAGEFKLVLPDGTVVWMNAESYLRFPEVFAEKSRKVYAKGELYFEVAHDEKRPFKVEVEDGYVIEVLGTEFNMRAYKGLPWATTLVKGKVLIEKGEKRVVLRPGQQAVSPVGGEIIQVKEVNVESYIAWRKGYFLFDNERLEDIMHELSRWYDVQVFFENQQVKDERFSVELRRHDDFKDVLDLIERTGSVKITIKEHTVFVR